MLSIDPTTQKARDNYMLLTGSVVPRPIAWVTSLSEEGVINAAPYSFYNVISSDPPILCVSVQRYKGAIPKDTSRNIQFSKAFVVHVVDEANVEAMNLTAAPLAPQESEVDAGGLTAVDSVKIKVPGIKEAKIRMECELESIIPIGGSQDSPACDLIIGRVVHFHIAEELYEDGKINTAKLMPIGRLAGTEYAKLGETFSIARPT